VEQRLQASVREKEVLLKEIHHRVKNNMQIVDSLLYLQAQAIKDRVDPLALDAFSKSESRIKSMASIHDRLYRSGDLASVDCGEYLRALVPELMDILVRYDQVIFVDAHVRDDVPDLHCEPVSAAFGPSAFTHHMTPAMLLALLKAIHGREPTGHIVSIRGRDFDFHHRLSAEVEALVEPAAERILRMIAPAEENAVTRGS
jgi:Ni,Fe-hydrogenase maturation factor